MVWQDFAVVCAIYPQTPEFLEVMLQEAAICGKKAAKPPLAGALVWRQRGRCSLGLRVPGPCAQQTHSGGSTPGRIPVRSLPPLSAQLPICVAGSDRYWRPQIDARRACVGSARLLQELFLHGASSTFYKQNRLPRLPQPFLHQELHRRAASLALARQPQSILHSTDWTGNPHRINLMANQEKELSGAVPNDISDSILASQASQADAKNFFADMTRLHKCRPDLVECHGRLAAILRCHRRLLL